MYRLTVVILFGLLAGAVATGLGDFAWLSSQASVVVFWVVPSLAVFGAMVGLFRYRRIS